MGDIPGVKASTLNNDVLFLTLGLGAGDTPVHAEGLARHMIQRKEADVAALASATANPGGAAGPIMPLAEALAPLAGASTALSAPSPFRIHAGIAVTPCFSLRFSGSAQDPLGTLSDLSQGGQLSSGADLGDSRPLLDTMVEPAG